MDRVPESGEIGIIPSTESINMTIEKIVPDVCGLYQIKYLATSASGEFRDKTIVALCGEQAIGTP